MSDDMPEQPKTVRIETPPDWAVAMSERMVAEFGKTNANIAIVSNDLGVVKERLGIVEDWKRKQELVPSIPPPSPLTSQRVGAIVDERASQMNLEQDARFAVMLVAKDEEIAKLRAESATKADIAKALDDAARTQTAAIVEGVKATVDTIAKTDTWQKLKGALVPVLMVAIALIGIKLQAAVAKLETTPAPAPSVVYVAAPHDAGADQ